MDNKKTDKDKSKKKSIFEGLVNYFPQLPKKLIVANIGSSPPNYLKNSTIDSFIKSTLATLAFLFLLIRIKKSLFFSIPIFIVAFFIFFKINLLGVDKIILSRRNAIDRESIYAGRYMLLKLYSGTPLLNTLIEQSKGEGAASKYIKEIVDDINSGSSIEESLDNAITYCPSDKFRKILFYIGNALKYGVDVTGPLESAINQIIEEKMIEIEKYGKKMNSFVIFYMLLGVVLPSLGITMIMVISGFVGINFDKGALFIMNFLILMSQLMFLSLIKGKVPSIDI